MAKQFTYDQVAAKKDKAARFVDDVLDDPDRADEINDESVESYAERKHIQIINPRRNPTMANGNGRTKQDLLDEIDQLQQENDDLQNALDTIADIVAPPDEEDEGDDQDDDDDGNGN